MCSKGGGSPPVPNASSTSFQSTVGPSPFIAPMYSAFLNQAQGLAQTPFNPAMLGQVAPMNANETAAGQQLFDLGMHLGEFDPAKVREIESPYTEDVVNATQNWFNNQNVIQGTGLLSQAIRSGNAFGGDRAGIAEAQLAGQQQLAQAPVIAGLRQAGYTQALDDYNRLKQFGVQGAAAALGWGQMQQAQAQKELDVAQQNAMMQSAYPFQTANWYGSVLGGIGPLTGSQALGFTTPPAPNQLSQGLGLVSAAVGLGGSLLNRGGAVGGRNMGWRYPRREHALGGLVDNPRRRARGGGLAPLTLDQLSSTTPSQDDAPMRLAGDVIALPIAPGPQAGRPTVEERFEGRAQQLPLILPSGTRVDRGAPLYQGYSPGPRGYQEGGPVVTVNDAPSFSNVLPGDESGGYGGYRRRDDDDDDDRRRRDDNRIPDIAGQLRLSPQTLPHPIMARPQRPQQDDTTKAGIDLLSSGIGLATKLAPLALLAVKHGGAIAGLQSGGSTPRKPPSVYEVPSIFGQLQLPARQLPQPTLPPQVSGAQQQQDPLTAGLKSLTSAFSGLKKPSSSSGSSRQS